MSIALILHKFDCPWVSDDIFAICTVLSLYSFEFVVVVAVVLVVAVL